MKVGRNILLFFCCLRVANVIIEKRKLISEAWDSSGPRERERPPLEADTKQLLLKAQKTLSVLYFGVCNSVRLSYLFVATSINV
jgi:hypothetical protein